MKSQLLNYRILITPDAQTGTGEKGYSAICPTLGVAGDGVTVEEAMEDVKGAIQVYLDSLAEDGEILPFDQPELDIVTTAQVFAPKSSRV